MRTNSLTIKKLFVLKYFFVGIAIAFLVHASGSCRKDSYNQNDDAIVGKINDGAKSAEAAFISGDPAAIESIMTDAAKELYGTDLPQIDKEELISLGKALKNRELKVYSDLYAEFNYTKDGVEYSIAMAQQEDGSWKLMRF